MTDDETAYKVAYQVLKKKDVKHHTYSTALILNNSKKKLLSSTTQLEM